MADKKEKESLSEELILRRKIGGRLSRMVRYDENDKLLGELDSGVSPDHVVGTGRAAVPIVCIAARAGNVEAVRMLLDRVADADAPDACGRNALFYAVFSRRSVEIAGLLLEKGADPNRRCKYGCVPLAEAALRNKLELCRLLVEAGADPSARTGKKGMGRKDAAALAREWGSGRAAPYLESAGDRARLEREIGGSPSAGAKRRKGI